MARWDRRGVAAAAKARDRAVTTQVRDAVAPFSPYWRVRLRELGRSAEGIDTVAALATLPAAGERDLCPDGESSGAARLVLQADEKGYALHADGPAVRKALGRRLVLPGSYRALVENDTRPTSFVAAGLSVEFPLASTRSDLDLVARAGARAFDVLGLTSSDVLVSALPHAPSAESQALALAALARRVPHLAAGEDPAGVQRALSLLTPTVLAVASAGAAALLGALTDAVPSLRTLLLVGAPTPAERVAATEALVALGAAGASVLAVHAPSGARVLWAQCREGAGSAQGSGFHTYPDLDVVQTVDPETGEPPADPASGGELVLTQLGFRGSALLRWRTGDVLPTAVSVDVCPHCRRTVPRVATTLARAALVPSLRLRGNAGVGVDLRAVAGALEGLVGVDDWRLLLRRAPRTGHDQLVVHVRNAGGDAGALAVDVARDVLAVSGVAPTQVVVAGTGLLPATTAGGPSRRSADERTP